MAPKTLIDAVKARTVVPFVGAGLSASVGRGIFPDWRGLIERLAARLDREALGEFAIDVRAHVAAQRLPEAAELAFEKLTPSRFGDEMQKAFRREAPPNADLSAVEALWRLRPPALITTNYDSVLEWPFVPRFGRPYPPADDVPQIVHNDDPSLIQLIATVRANERPLIWHLHGSVDRPDTMILTRGQYERLYGVGSLQIKEYVSALDQLRGLIANRTLLFVGFSLDDPFIRAQLEYILDVTSKQNPVSFMLTRKGDKDAAALLGRFQVQTIEFEAFGPPMVRAINEIAEEAWGPRASGVSVPGSLVGLVEELATVLGRMAPAPAVAGRAFNRWKPAGWATFPLGGDGVALSLTGAEKLAGAMRQATGYYPLLEFVRELALGAPNQHKAKLFAWLKAAADALGADDADSERLQTGAFVPPESAIGNDNYVLVRLDEARTDNPDDKWSVQAWLFNGSEPWKLFPEEQKLADSNLSDVIYQLLDCITSLELPIAQTTVAFMVPRALLVEAIDQVEPTLEFTPSPPIGVTLPVTVRPLERLKYPRSLRQLGITWQALKASGTAAFTLEDAVPPANQGAAIWLTPAHAGVDLVERLQRHKVTCAVLAVPPAAQALNPTMDLLNCVLQAAVPAVFWLREPAAADLVTARARIEELLNQEETALPHRVWKRRQEARALAAELAHPGQCLVLLWDDADRLPPDRNPLNRAGIPRV